MITFMNEIFSPTSLGTTDTEVLNAIHNAKQAKLEREQFYIAGKSTSDVQVLEKDGVMIVVRHRSIK